MAIAYANTIFRSRLISTAVCAVDVTLLIASFDINELPCGGILNTDIKPLGIASFSRSTGKANVSVLLNVILKVSIEFDDINSGFVKLNLNPKPSEL